MKHLISSVVVGAVMAPSAFGAVTVDVDASASWEAFMEVFNLPVPDGDGAFQFGSGWGLSDAVTTLDVGANTVTASPNTISDPNEYWYQNTSGTAADPTNPGGPGQAGNKIMQANSFIADDSLVGEEITFQGEVLSNTLTGAHEMEIWIRDFAPDYSSFNDTTIVAPASGTFSITLITDPTPGRHIQYGFTLRGENVWATDVAPFGSVVLGAVPEPASAALAGLGALCLMGRRRSQG